MNNKLALSAFALAALAVPAGGLTLEELSARLERVEGKLAAYEKRFGPLEGEGPLPHEMQRSIGVAPTVAAPKGGMAPAPAASDAASIDDSFGLGSGTYTAGGSWWERTTLGGYGEMHLSLSNDRENEIDFHRWVLFLNHRFSDRITLNSELELEHSLSGDGKPGEVELEQAYLDFDLGGGFHAKGGLFLLPVGTINETHEPDTFFGVERNPIEKEIIPTTWWEGGVALSQVTDTGLSWDLAVHSGLDVPTTGSNAYRIRSGRQKVAEAPAEEPAVTARVRYTGIPGVDVSVFGNYQADITQTAGTEDNAALLLGASASVQSGGFALKGLVAHWNIDGDMVMNAGRDVSQQWGFYVEPSYTFDVGERSKVGVFGRWSWYEFARNEVDQYDLGVNFWPVDNVVLKADFSHIDPKFGNTEDVFNFGVGYSF